jgi:hypothetical protein
MMQGWHSMYYNDVEKAYDVANWCTTHTEEDSARSESESECEDLVDESFKLNNVKKFHKIAVVLAGLFTQRQKAIVYKQCNVRWGYIKAALNWLKTWNIG